jgi:hypothetical protein
MLDNSLAVSLLVKMEKAALEALAVSIKIVV